MKGFIKIADVHQREHYINIDYIIKFTTASEGHEGNTILVINKIKESTTIQTTTTCEEVVDMIDLANK
jgi:hypothetical protein